MDQQLIRYFSIAQFQNLPTSNSTKEEPIERRTDSFEEEEMIIEIHSEEENEEDGIVDILKKPVKDLDKKQREYLMEKFQKDEYTQIQLKKYCKLNKLSVIHLFLINFFRQLVQYLIWRILL